MKILKTTPTQDNTTPSTRTGKIARLPKSVRDELNRRLLDGQSGRLLVEWLNSLPEVQAALKREFDGRDILPQNLSEWRRGGFREAVARMEAEQCLAHMMEDLAPPAEGEKAGSLYDRVTAWFFPQYVAAAQGQLAAARTPAERWAVLRTILADLAALRREEHQAERLRLWRDKLEVQAAKKKEITLEDVIAFGRKQPDEEDFIHAIFPDREYLTYEERQDAMRQILGLRPIHSKKGLEGEPVGSAQQTEPPPEGQTQEPQPQEAQPPESDQIDEFEPAPGKTIAEKWANLTEMVYSGKLDQPKSNQIKPYQGD